MTTMTKRRILAGVFSLLALAAVIGANLANAGGDSSPAQTAVESEAEGSHAPDTDSIEYEGQDGADDADEAEGTGAEEPEGTEAEEAKAGDEAEADLHEDAGENAEHQCPPDCG